MKRTSAHLSMTTARVPDQDVWGFRDADVLFFFCSFLGGGREGPRAMVEIYLGMLTTFAQLETQHVAPPGAQCRRSGRAGCIHIGGHRIRTTDRMSNAGGRRNGQ